jgi:hypothetical protein
VTTDAPGDPISYLVLAPGTPVYARGGVAVGRVREVLADEGKDVFDGIIIRTAHGDRFVDRDQVGPLYERAVLVNLSAEQCLTLPPPSANPAVLQADPAEAASGAERLRDMARDVWDRLSGKR